MGDDEYHPLRRKGSNLTDAGGIGYTVVDSIDTMLLMGLHEEYKQARDWVEHKMFLDRDGEFNTFEARCCFIFFFCINASFLRDCRVDDNTGSRRPPLGL
jgi:Glycosyl hydrolase family 47